MVKYKEYRSISTLYIYESYEEIIYNTCIKQVIEQWKLSKNRAPTTWGANWDYFGTADHVIIILYPSPYCIHEVSIITIYDLTLIVNGYEI